jgi:hypothetical protein
MQRAVQPDLRRQRRERVVEHRRGDHQHQQGDAVPNRLTNVKNFLRSNTL